MAKSALSRPNRSGLSDLPAEGAAPAWPARAQQARQAAAHHQRGARAVRESGSRRPPRASSASGRRSEPERSSSTSRRVRAAAVGFRDDAERLLGHGPRKLPRNGIIDSGPCWAASSTSTASARSWRGSSFASLPRPERDFGAVFTLTQKLRDRSTTSLARRRRPASSGPTVPVPEITNSVMSVWAFWIHLWLGSEAVAQRNVKRHLRRGLELVFEGLRSAERRDRRARRGAPSTDALAHSRPRSRLSLGRDQGGVSMTAYNVVRFKVKPGREQQFIDYQRRAVRGFADSRADRSFRPATRPSAWSASGSRSRARQRAPADDRRARRHARPARRPQVGLGVTDPVARGSRRAGGRASRRAAFAREKGMAAAPERRIGHIEGRRHAAPSQVQRSNRRSGEDPGRPDSSLS